MWRKKIWQNGNKIKHPTLTDIPISSVSCPLQFINFDIFDVNARNQQHSFHLRKKGLGRKIVENVCLIFNVFKKITTIHTVQSA